MSALHNDVYDAALNLIKTNSEKLVILSADPGLTYANISTYLLGTKIAPTIGSPADRTGGGREIIISAISDGSVSATGENTATHFALVDDTNSRVLTSQALNASQTVTGGNTFTLTSLAVGLPDPA